MSQFGSGVDTFQRPHLPHVVRSVVPMTARCAGATNPVAPGTASVIPPRMTREQVAVKGLPRDQLRGFPDIGQDELIRFFTLMPADVEFVASRRARDPAQGLGLGLGLGLAVQLCTLSRLGSCRTR